MIQGRRCIRIFGCVLSVLCSISVLPSPAAEAVRRVVSLGPYLTESLFALRAEEYVVGVTSYCVRPEQARQVAKVGGVVDVNAERIVALRPDAVLATPLTQVKAREKLRSLGIRVIDFEQPKNFADICEQLRRLARLVDRTAPAEDIINAAQARLAAVRQRIAAQPAVTVFLQVGSRPLFTMTRGNFVNDMVEQAGGKNIAASAASGLYSREMVISQDPEVLIIATMGIVSEDEQRQWERYPGLRAVQNHRIYTLDPYLVGSPNPLNFAHGVELIADFLHPRSGGTHE